MTTTDKLTPFVLCIDNNPFYLRSAMVCLQSINDNTPGVEVIVATYGVPDVKRRALQHWANRELRPKNGLKLSLLDVSGLDIACLPIDEANPFQYSPAIFIRLYLPELLQRNFVYLDADVLVMTDLTSLRSIDPGERIVAAVANPYYTDIRDRGLYPRQQPYPLVPAELGHFLYPNTGVMVVNAEEWLDAGCTDACISYVLSRPNGLPCPFGDQDSLAAVLAFKGIDFLVLDPHYNVPTVTEDLVRYPGAEIPNIGQLLGWEKKPGILHPTGRPKFWEPSFPDGENYQRYLLVEQRVPYISDDGSLTPSPQNTQKTISTTLD